MSMEAIEKAAEEYKEQLEKISEEFGIPIDLAAKMIQKLAQQDLFLVSKEDLEKLDDVG